MDTRFTFSIGSGKLDKIKLLVNKKEAISDFINRSIDFYINHLETKFLSEFLYYIGFPTVAFLGFVGITLLFPNLFFYILTGVTGIYICILFYLFYNKYRKEKENGR